VEVSFLVFVGGMAPLLPLKKGRSPKKIEKVTPIFFRGKKVSMVFKKRSARGGGRKKSHAEVVSSLPLGGKKGGTRAILRMEEGKTTGEGQGKKKSRPAPKEKKKMERTSDRIMRRRKENARRP